MNQAREGLRSLKDNVDCLIVIDNEKIKRIYGSQTISAAFAKANDVLNIAAKGIAEVITLPGYINVDFADVKTVMTNSGVAIMGAAQASGEDRARRAITEALDSPLLNNNDIRGAKDILLNITSGTDEVTMNEMTEITSIIIHRVGDSAAVIWGVGTDESLGSAVSVTIIATGFPKDDIEILDQQPGDRKAENDLILRDDEVVLKPNLTPEEIKELIEEPVCFLLSVLPEWTVHCVPM